MLWGAAFILSEAEEIRFDIIYSAHLGATRRMFTVITGVALVLLYGISLPADLQLCAFMKVEHSAYLHVPLDWMYSIYLIFAVACIVRYCWLAWRAIRGGQSPKTDPAKLERLSNAAQSLHALHHRASSLLGAARPADRPFDDRRRRSSICCSPGLDLGTAAEQILNGLFNSYVLLAMPLFILAADLMNTGSLTDRLLHFCLVLVGRFRGGLGHVNVVANMIFAGMSGSAIADAVGIGRIIIGMMTKGKYPIAYAGAITASAAIIGPIIPPSIPMVLYALVSDTSIGYLFLGGVVPGCLLGVALHGHELHHRAAPQLSRSSRRSRCARCRGSRIARLPGADAAGDPAVRHLRRRDDADRRRRGGRLRAARLDGALPRRDLEAALRRHSRQRQGDRPRSAC